jgi:hypothetical protein
MGHKEDFNKDFYLKSTWEWIFKRYKNPKLADFLTSRIAKVHREGYACTSHLRLAEVGNEVEMKLYKEIAAEGC